MLGNYHVVVMAATGLMCSRSSADLLLSAGHRLAFSSRRVTTSKGLAAWLHHLTQFHCCHNIEKFLPTKVARAKQQVQTAAGPPNNGLFSKLWAPLGCSLSCGSLFWGYQTGTLILVTLQMFAAYTCHTDCGIVDRQLPVARRAVPDKPSQ